MAERWMTQIMSAADSLDHTAVWNVRSNAVIGIFLANLFGDASRNLGHF